MAALRATVALLLVSLAAAQQAISPARQQYSFHQLFSAIDTDKDGELSAAEAELYAAGALDMASEGWSAGEAAAFGRGALDGPDRGETISAAELRQHLRDLLQDHRVEEWVTHGLSLPQYAAAFKANGITALDFPFLVADGGAALQADLGVASRLHQQQILRGLKRLILGLGQLPAAPLQLGCTAVNKTAVLLTWQAPPLPGHPAFHKYVLQRQRVAPGTTWHINGSSAEVAAAGAGSALAGGAGVGALGAATCALVPEERWELAGEPDDQDFSWEDAPPAKGTYRYRLTAWSAFGHGPFMLSAGACTVRAVQRAPPPLALLPAQPLPPAEVQAIIAAVAAAGGNLSARQVAALGAAAGSGWSWSAASSALVVALSIVLKVSQLRLGAVACTLWRSFIARWRQPGGAAGAQQAPAASEAQQAQQQQQQQDGQGRGAAPGLRRVGTSQASLASLGSERETEGQHNGQPTLLASRSSSQLEGLCSGLDAGCASEEALAEVDEVAAEQLQLAVLRGTHCAHPGCHRRFDRLRDMRRRLESHYCALCQRMYCLHHTRISPHGTRGGCGLESKCACYACFAELAPAQQAAYERANRLPKPASVPGAGSNGAAAAAAAAAGGDIQAAVSGPVSGGASPPQQPGAASPPAVTRSPSKAALAAGAARKRWQKAGKVLLALARFKAAGSAPTSPVQ